MGIISRISLRNLTRQKRRNSLLALGIGFGMMILVIANSFSNGLIDVLINEIVANISGHVSISRTEDKKQIFRNKEEIEKMLDSFGDTVIYKTENIGVFSTVIGNGKSDNMVFVGLEDSEENWTEFMRIIEGSVEDYATDKYMYPVVISPSKAKALNVKVGDVIKTRLNMVTGQVQSANMQVIAIGESSNTFMSVVAFMELNKLKKLLGYKENEAGAYQIALKDPEKNSKIIADKLHELMKADILNIIGKANEEDIQLFAYENNKETYKSLFDTLEVVKGQEKNYLSKAGVLISEELSKKIGVDVGEKFLLSYQSKNKGLYEEELQVQGIFKAQGKFTFDTVIVNGERIYKSYNSYIPKNTVSNYFSEEDSFYNALAKEYFLYERVHNATELQKVYRQERRVKSKRAKVSITTMYESASQILQMKTVLTGVTMVVVLVLFFIILIGVVNTLRMTIKERTREIGTLRAIGMQAKDVKNSFILESVYLTIIACIGGTLLGMLISTILGTIKFSSESALSFILIDGSIKFIYSPGQIIFNIGLIVLITAVTAYFPARKASKINAASALRHYE